MLNNLLYEYFGITDYDRDIRPIGNELKAFIWRRFRLFDSFWKLVYQNVLIIVPFVASIIALIGIINDARYHEEQMASVARVKIINYNQLIDSLKSNNSNNEIIKLLEKSNYNIIVDIKSQNKPDKDSSEVMNKLMKQ